MSRSDGKVRESILRDLEEISNRMGFVRTNSITRNLDETTQPDLILKKGNRILIIQIRIYGWGGAEIVDAKSIFPLLIQFETIKKNPAFDQAKRLIVSPYEFNEEAKNLAKDFDVETLSLSFNPSLSRLQLKSIKKLQMFLQDIQ
jgi:hypothetical protein